MPQLRKLPIVTMSISALAATVLTGVTEAAVLGQVDDFEDLTTQNWTGAPDLFVNEPTGGPTGDDDAFLQVTGVGGNGPGSRISVRNDVQWQGDYVAAGIDAIAVDMANFGSSDFDMRVQMWGFDGDVFTSTVAALVPADGVWRTFIFELTDAGLTQTSGTGSLSSMLTGVARFQFRHQSGAPAGPTEGTPIAGVLGLDNITAIPAPAALAVFIVGGVWAPRRRRSAG